ncbi:membrane-spanning 4-domains subfamily A member 4D-like [Salminus brasiliensis]|uniref:membrane-spanning 4-domains subfamily A member 4D-like n=1 Tax=Salminus brasiliensis TaxID=930266 RepID=UPI003B836E64
MSTTLVPTNSMENGFIIVTHVIPEQPAPSGTAPSGPGPGAGFFNGMLRRTLGHQQDQSTPDLSSSCLKREPKVLGTVQIMTGGMIFLLCIVLTQNNSMLLFTQSLLSYWGAIIYITAGTLSVAAGNKFHPHLAKALLVVNAFSAVTAGTAIVLHSLDIAYGSVNTAWLQSQIDGISGVLLFFSLLQFIISICMLLFGLDVTYCAEPTVCSGSGFPGRQACCSLNNPFHVHNNEEDVFVISNPNIHNSLPAGPPPYNEIEPQFQP